MARIDWLFVTIVTPRQLLLADYAVAISAEV